jgi:choline kinase
MIHGLILVPEITKGMKSLGSKALLQIKKKISVLEYQIDSILDIDKNIKITICSGFEHEKISFLLNDKYSDNINYVYNPEYKNTNQGYSIKLFFDTVYKKSDSVLILNNGIILKKKCLNKSMLGNESKIFILNKKKEEFKLGCSSSKKLDYIFYDLPESWSECIYLNKISIEVLQKIIEHSSINQMYLFEIINQVISNNNITIEKEYIDKKMIMKVNTPKDILKARYYI